MATLDQGAFNKALIAFERGAVRNSETRALQDAIRAYMDEAFKPGPIVELSTAEFAPQRDYRKELWIAHWQSMPAGQDFKGDIARVQRAVKAFDEFFNEGTTP